MRVKVGHWKTGLAVSMDTEAFDWLKANGRALCVQMQMDRRLLLVTCSKGGCLTKLSAGPNRDRSLGVGFVGHANVPLPYFEFLQGPGFELPLFEIPQLNADYDYSMDGLLTEPLAADHDLPWPDSTHGAVRLTAEELRHQCLLRIRSSLAAGGRGHPEDCRVSRSVVRMMGRGFQLAHEQALRERGAA